MDRIPFAKNKTNIKREKVYSVSLWFESLFLYFYLNSKAKPKQERKVKVSVDSLILPIEKAKQQFHTSWLLIPPHPRPRSFPYPRRSTHSNSLPQPLPVPRNWSPKKTLPKVVSFRLKTTPSQLCSTYLLSKHTTDTTSDSLYTDKLYNPSRHKETKLTTTMQNNHTVKIVQQN